MLRIVALAVQVLALVGGIADNQLLRNPLPVAPVLVVIALVLTGVRWFRPSVSVIDQGVDVAVVGGILFVSEGIFSPFALFGAGTAFSLGVTAGLARGVFAAVLLVIAGFDLPQGGDGVITAEVVRTAIGWILLYPVGAVLGGLVRMVTVDRPDDQALLVETNRVLTNLERLAAAAPEALSSARVATAAAAHLRRTLDGDAALVLGLRDGALVELGRDAIIDLGPQLLLTQDVDAVLALGSPRRLVDHALPPRLSRALPALGHWVVVGMRSGDRRIGVAVVGGNDLTDPRSVQGRLSRLANETAVALENTELFGRVELAAATAERERLASDLHDGVAQQLTHVRFELQLLARSIDDESARSELDRLARVAQRASDDVRSAIRGLRAQALDEGLIPALRSLLTDLESPTGPRLEFDVLGAATLPPDTDAEVYRIVQEAISNALRHADATNVRVVVDVIAQTLVVVVEDDGHGFDERGAEDGDGLGLRTMRARAERVGADFSIGESDEGGVRVDLRLPLDPEPTRPPTPIQESIS